MDLPAGWDGGAEMMLTGEQRYRQACLKARLRGNRTMRDCLSGVIPFLPTSNPRDDIVRELERAYKIGFEDGKKAATAPAPLAR